MDSLTDALPDVPAVSMIHGVGFRLLLWIVSLFVVTLAIFVGLDLMHETRVLAQLGATPGEIARIRAETIRIHALHGVVSIGAFAIAIVVVVRQLVTVRVRAILRAIHHFRHGTWHIRLPRHALDEIECVAEAFRRLGPHLDRAFTTFVECDRKATVARLGAAYERALSPLAHRLRALGKRTRGDAASDLLRRELEDLAMTMLAELGRLGRPEHPAVSEILQSFGSAGVGCPDGLVATRNSVVPSIGDQDEPRVA